MSLKFSLPALVIALMSFQNIYAQTDKEKALEKGRQAIRLVDEGKIEEGIKLLEEAQKLDPKNKIYPYELGYAYYTQKDYKKAIKYFESILDHPDVDDQVYQMLGNSFDMMGKTEKALEAYEDGLKKFPTSGKLYLEQGNVYWGKKEYAKALPYYEQGIKVDPRFPSNYYRAARLYCASTEEVWGMIYGEIFMNLERGSARTAEISKLLYDTYKSEIKFTSDSSMTVSFCQQMTINADAITDPKNIKLPFCMIYEPTLLIPIAFHKTIDLNSLHDIRQGFVEQYFKMGHNKTHPNILFDYQNRILKEGHLESYNHWLLMKGDEEAFKIWQTANEDKWKAFIKWFTDNGLKLDEENKFHRTQY